MTYLEPLHQPSRVCIRAGLPIDPQRFSKAGKQAHAQADSTFRRRQGFSLAIFWALVSEIACEYWSCSMDGLGWVCFPHVQSCGRKFKVQLCKPQETFTALSSTEADISLDFCLDFPRFCFFFSFFFFFSSQLLSFLVYKYLKFSNLDPWTSPPSAYCAPAPG